MTEQRSDRGINDAIRRVAKQGSWTEKFGVPTWHPSERRHPTTPTDDTEGTTTPATQEGGQPSMSELIRRKAARKEK